MTYALDLELVAEIRDRVAGRLTENRREEPQPDIDDLSEGIRAEPVIWQCLDEYAQELVLDGKEHLGTDLEQAIARRIKADLFGLGGLEDHIFEKDVENVYVNGADRVFVSRAGADEPEQVAPIAESDEALIQLINRWAARSGRTERRFDVANPRLDLRLPGGFRLHAIMEVTARPTVTIRCPYNTHVSLGDLIAKGTMDAGLVEFLTAAVKSRCNIIVAGGTGTGKTTLLRAMLLNVPARERIITIEDTAELGLGQFQEQHPNVVEMETRQANVEGVGELTMLELTRECLRMSPDRVVIGEVRGAEALYMLKAMSQGNDGSMCTVHADSAVSVADRVRGYCAEGVSTLPMAVIDGFYRNAVDLVVHLKVLDDKRRVINQIVEVVADSSDGFRYNHLYSPNPDGYATPTTAPTAELFDKLKKAGMSSTPW